MTGLDDWVDELSGQLREARRRQRRWPLIAAAALTLTVAVAAVVGAGLLARTRSAEREQPGPPAVRDVAFDQLVRRTYLGRACPDPNTAHCERIGIYVQVRGRAQAVEALPADGRAVPLDDPDWSVPRQGVYADFISEKRLRPEGESSGSSVDLTVRVTRPDGRILQTHTRTTIAPGWG